MSLWVWCKSLQWRYNGRDASQITSLRIVNSVVYSGADQRKNQSSASLAFVRGIHRWPMSYKWLVTRNFFSIGWRLLDTWQKFGNAVQPFHVFSLHRVCDSGSHYLHLYTHFIDAIATVLILSPHTINSIHVEYCWNWMLAILTKDVSCVLLIREHHT